MAGNTVSTILNYCKLTLRITSNAYDEQITNLIGAARIKMVAGGVLAEKANDDTDPIVRLAIATFVCSTFGLDNNEAERLGMSFESFVTQLKGTTTYGQTLEDDE